MRFSILGPVAAAADDGTPFALARPSVRSTLAVLLLYAGQRPSRTLLIDALWGENPPSDADGALRVRIREVRRALAGHDRLVTHQAGYQICVEPGELDIASFRDLAAHGRAALDQGSPADAARILDQAGQLWREPALCDLPDTPLLLPVRTALLDERRDVQEWLIDARLALGQHHEAITQIRACLAADSLSEHPHVQLMLALYRSGHKSAALAAYTRLRELTVREFGQDPGPEARALLRQILADSPDLQYRPRSPAPTGTTLPAWTPVWQLPAAPADFTGRVAEIESLARRLPLAAGVAVTVISGPPGAGKTTLAVQAGHLFGSKFPDGQLYTALGVGVGVGVGVGGGAGGAEGAGGAALQRSAADVLGELLQSLGVPAARIPAGLPERAGLYRSLLAGRRVLVVADDAVSAAQIRPLLPGTDGTAVLVTSSSRLPDLEGAVSLGISGLSTAEAVELLAKIAGPERVAAEPEAAAAIVTACDGLPLAVRIAGARLAASPGQRLGSLADAMADEGRLLSELTIGDLSVRNRLDRTWRGLDSRSRTALRALAREGRGEFPDWLVLSAAGGRPTVAQALSDAGMIFQNPETGRYRMAPLAACHVASQPGSPG